MSSKTILGIVGLVVLAVAAYVVFINSKVSGPEIYSMGVTKPNLVVYAKGLDRVEVWVVPTGTGLTDADYMLLGEASSTDNLVSQLWKFPIPLKPLPVSAIFAVGYKKGALVGKVGLPQNGATQIFDVLWGVATST